MDPLKLHILLNYYPAIGVIIGTVLLAAGLWFGKAGIRQLALKLFVFMALLTLVVALAGEVASWAVAFYEGQRMAALTGHKHTATAALALMVMTGILSLVRLVRSGTCKDGGNRADILLLIMGIVSSAMLVTTILKGRQVKWAFLFEERIPTLSRSIAMEKRSWHV